MKFLLFSLESYKHLADKMLETDKFEAGVVERRNFPDGERYLRILSEVRERDTVVMGGTGNAHDTLELYDLAYALSRNGAKRVSIVIPYYGYSTMERAVKTGEVVTAKSRAHLLSSIPSSAHSNRIFLFDLHAEGVTFYFEGSTRATHISARPVIENLIRTVGEKDFVLGSADAGRAKWVESLANKLGVPAAVVLKRRLSAEKTEVTAVSDNVKGKHVVLYDDMIRTGGSLMGAAKAYLAHGAVKVSAVTTHGVFPGQALEKLVASGLFASLACTDSCPRAVELEGPKLKVASLSDLIVESLGGAL